MERIEISKDVNQLITICVGEDYKNLILTRSRVWKSTDFNGSEIFFRDSDQSKDRAFVYSNLDLKLRIEVTDPKLVSVLLFNNPISTDELEKELFKTVFTKIVESGQYISFLSMFSNTFYHFGSQNGRKTAKEMISHAISNL